MSREARGAVLVVALFGLFLLALVLRRRLDDGGAPTQRVEAVERAAPAPPVGEPALVATPADEQPGGSDGTAPVLSQRAEPPVEAALRPTARLRVKVVSSGARVRLRGVLHADGLRPRTEQAEGELDLECREGDWVDVVALAPGHAPRRFALRAPSPEVVVRLSRAGAGALRGRVVDHDGAPGRELLLRVTSGGEDAGASTGPTSAGVVEERPVGPVQGEGKTRDDGSFTIDGLAEGARVRLVVGGGLAVEATVGDEELLVTLPRPGTSAPE